VDVDQVTLNKAIENRLTEIDHEILADLSEQRAQMDLIDSRIIGEPFGKVQRALNRFNFYPIKQQYLVDLQEMFKGSKILRKEHFTIDFYIEVLPKKGLLDA